MRAVEAVCEIVVAEGIERLFGLMGDGNMAVITYLASAHGIPFFTSRHETAAIGMADGYARITGGLTVCTVTQGPGLTNAITGLVTAKKARSPLVLVTGDVAASQRGWPQDLDHESLLDGLGVPILTVDDPATAHLVAQAAFRRAREESCPVVLNLPLDVQERDWTPWEEQDADPAPEAAVAVPDPAAVQKALAALQAARKPVIVAGRGALRADCRQALEALGDAVGALLATTLPAKGFFAGNPHDIGVVGSLATNLAARLIGEADCIVAFGASLNDFTTMKGSLFDPSATVIRCDLVTASGPNRYEAELGITGDAGVIASALADAAAAAGEHAEGYRTPKITEDLATHRVADEFADTTQPGAIDPRTLAIELDRLLPADRTVVTDVGHFFGFPSTYVAVPAGGRFLPAVEFGAVGVGLGTAIGAALARPDLATVLFVGDGGLVMSLPELATLTRYQVPLLVVVMNDSAYGSELHMLRAWELPTEAAEFDNPSFEAVATAFGVPARTVLTLEDLRAAVPAFTPGSGPLLLDCHVDQGVVAAWLEGAFNR